MREETSSSLVFSFKMTWGSISYVFEFWFKLSIVFGLVGKLNIVVLKEILLIDIELALLEDGFINKCEDNLVFKLIQGMSDFEFFTHL